MTVKSAPVSERPLSTTDWRYLFGNEPGIKEDNDGTAFALTLSTNSDEAIIGSATQDSTTIVGGGYLTVLAGTTERLAVPAPTGGTRTDLLVVRKDPAWEVLPTDPALQAAHIGPCRLFRVPGTEGGGVPVYDSTPPGIEDEVLYEITRTPGTALSSNGTTVKDRRVRTGPNLTVKTLADRPNQGVPLATRCYVVATGVDYVRVLDAQGAPQWVQLDQGNAGVNSAITGTTPPAGTPIISKYLNDAIKTNTNGDATIVYPGGAFPHGVTGIYAQVLDAIAVEWRFPTVTTSSASLTGFLGTARVGILTVRTSVRIDGW